MDFKPMTKKTRDEIAEEFSIRGVWLDRFDDFIAILEHALENPEFEFQSIGGRQRYNEYLRMHRQIEDVRQIILDVARSADPSGFPGNRMTCILPLDDDRTISAAQIFGAFDLPRPAAGESDIPASDATALATANYVLFRLQQTYQVETAFSAEGNRRRRGRPKNKVRASFIRAYLEHYPSCIGGYPNYGEKSICVTLCARLLDHYGIDAGDVSQIIKRELRRGD